MRSVKKESRRTPKTLYSRELELFVDLLIKERKKRRMTQVALANRLHCHQSLISKIESKQRRMDVVEFLNFAEGIGFDPVLFLKEFKRQLDRLA